MASDLPYPVVEEEKWEGSLKANLNGWHNFQLTFPLFHFSTFPLFHLAREGPCPIACSQRESLSLSPS
jgi:hypothetical protein